MICSCHCSKKRPSLSFSESKDPRLSERSVGVPYTFPLSKYSTPPSLSTVFPSFKPLKIVLTIIGRIMQGGEGRNRVPANIVYMGKMNLYSAHWTCVTKWRAEQKIGKIASADDICVCKSTITTDISDMYQYVMIFRLLGTMILIRAKMFLLRQSQGLFLCPLRMTSDLLL